MGFPGKSQVIDESVHFINYSINDGLPSSETYDVFQDSKGYMWIGTDNGVVRYDGADFEVFTTLDRLTDNTVFKIQEDYKGRIWFMTYNRKLCYFENEEFYPYRFNDELAENTNDIYVGHTISRFEIDSLDQIKLTLTNYSTIQIDSHGTVNVKRDHYLKNTKEQNALKESSSLIEVIKNTVPLLKNHFSYEKVTVYSSHFGVVHLFKNSNTIFFGSKTGLTIGNGITGAIDRQLLHNQYITGISIDNEGGIWCSSLYNGIFYLPSPELSLFPISLNNAKNHVHGIIPYENNLIFSFDKKSQYFKFNESFQKLKPFNEHLDFKKIPKNLIKKGVKLENPMFFDGIFSSTTSLIALTDNTYLFSGDKVGILLFDTELDSFNTYSTPDQEKTNPHIGYLGRKWYRCLEGIYFKNQTNRPVLNRSLPPFPNKVLKLFKDFNNKIWVGTPNGLFEFDNKTEEINKVQNDHHFVDYRIQDIIQTLDSSLIIGTKAHGVFIWQKNKVTTITMDSGLLSNTIHQLVYDANTNKIWVATNKGVSTLSQTENNSWKPTAVITKYDALTSVDIRQIAIHNGFLFMANNTGVSKISLNKLNKTLTPPLLHFKGLTVNNEIIAFKDTLLSFSYDSNTVKFNFQAIAFKSQNDITYSYKLIPIQNDWQTTKSNEVVFPVLPPGDFEFIVKSKNVQGVESKSEGIKFSILPAFWMTFWFQSLALLGLAYILYRIIRKVFQKYKEQSDFQKTLKEMQVISLQSKMNPHFIFNSLNSIQNFILKNEKDQASSYLMEFSKLIRKTLQNSDSPNVLLLDELETLNMYVDLEKRRLRNEFEYFVEIDNTIDIDNCEIPSLLIQPYIENAIWHGKIHKVVNGMIRLRINLVNKLLNFEILDNGIGIKASQKSKVLSLSIKHTSLANSITDKRIKILGELNQDLSEVIISDAFKRSTANPNVGTRVTFSIPYIVKSKS